MNWAAKHLNAVVALLGFGLLFLGLALKAVWIAAVVCGSVMILAASMKYLVPLLRKA